ncbi:AraC family transcriptional regulator [Streptomyces sp. NPDC086554]|uniref:AraC family transcriptional regulator n=1 Tax=Streptomyces sp. NPDC086554 TaxID=3154864 RepID=UPI003436933F
MQRLVLDHPEGDLTLRTLSRHAGLSERHLSRLFHAQASMSVREYVEQARVAFASRRLTETADSPESIAREVGGRLRYGGHVAPCVPAGAAGAADLAY